MQRIYLTSGDQVAVYPVTPVPTDPYAIPYRGTVRRAVVVDPHLVNGSVEITWMTPHMGKTRAWVEPRMILAPWVTWLERLADREEATHGQEDRATLRVSREADALASAREKYPAARIENHCIVIPIEDWLA